ncbi:hypothetical protein GCM10027569_38800 [Flindersiella endophytica]
MLAATGDAGLSAAMTLLGFGLEVVALNLVPGPGMMFIVAHGITGGRRGGIVAVFGGLALKLLADHT